MPGPPPVELGGRLQVERGQEHQRPGEIHVGRRVPGIRVAECREQVEAYGRGRKARSPPPLPRETASRGNPLPPPPRLLLPLWEERRDAQPEQVCGGSGSPLRLPPREGRRCRGSCTACREGREGQEGRVRLSPRAPSCGSGWGLSAPSRGPAAPAAPGPVSCGKTVSLPGGPIGASPRLVEKLQARPRREKTGYSSGKGESGRKRTRGVGARSAPWV